MVRMAVPTTVWSSADKNMPAIRPKMTNRIMRCVITGAAVRCDPVRGATAFCDMCPRRC